MNPERLEAAIRLLQDGGDLTPMGARILRSVNADEQPEQQPGSAGGYFCSPGCPDGCEGDHPTPGG